MTNLRNICTSRGFLRRHLHIIQHFSFLSFNLKCLCRLCLFPFALTRTTLLTIQTPIIITTCNTLVMEMGVALHALKQHTWLLRTTLAAITKDFIFAQTVRCLQEGYIANDNFLLYFWVVAGTAQMQEVLLRLDQTNLENTGGLSTAKVTLQRVRIQRMSPASTTVTTKLFAIFCFKVASVALLANLLGALSNTGVQGLSVAIADRTRH